MRYPTVSLTRCAEVAQLRIDGEDPPLGEQWEGDGDDVDLSRIETAARKIDDLLKEPRRDRDKDYVEGIASAHLYAALNPSDPRATGVPDISVLDDEGFWRYLALKFFWSFIQWRQPEAFEGGKHMHFLNAQSSRDTVLTRMYLRVAAVGGLAHAEHAMRLGRSADFWQSHILQVRTASAPPLTRAMVDKQSADRLNTQPLRETAKRVNRAWTNVLLNDYGDEAAATLIGDLWRDEA